MGWANIRRFPRYEPEALTFAVLRDGHYLIGRVVSVGRGGLAFEYAPFRQPDIGEEMDHHAELDLIVGRAPLYVPQIPCEILYDFKVKTETFLADGIATRCCGLKFGELSEEQTEAIDALLESFVLTPV